MSLCFTLARLRLLSSLSADHAIVDLADRSSILRECLPERCFICLGNGVFVLIGPRQYAVAKTQ